MPLHLGFFPFPLLIGLGILSVFLAILVRKKRNIFYLFCVSIFWLYLLAVIGTTLFPIPFWIREPGRSSIPAIVSRVNLVPLNYGRLFDLSPSHSLRELGGNILLAIPFGFGLSFILSFRVRNILWPALGFGAAIELSQLAISMILGAAYRSVDINDVLLNALGVLIGFGLFRGISSSLPTL